MRRNLTKDEILRKSSDIRAVFRQGTSVRTNNITVVIRKKTESRCRILAIIKKSRTAVLRNVGRRRIKEAFRTIKPLFNTSFDMIVIVVRNIPSFADISAAIRQSLSRHRMVQE